LTEHRGEFFAGVNPTTVGRFKRLFELLNASVV
jgi:hypothetical protein